MDNKYRSIVAICIVVILFGSDIQSSNSFSLSNSSGGQGQNEGDKHETGHWMPPPTKRLKSVDDFSERMKNGKLQCTNEDFDRLMDVYAKSYEELSSGNYEQIKFIVKEYIVVCSNEVNGKLLLYKSSKLNNLRDIYREMRNFRRFFKMDDPENISNFEMDNSGYISNSKLFLWTPAHAKFSEWLSFIDELAIKQNLEVIFESEEQSEELIDLVVRRVLNETCGKISEDVPLRNLFEFGLKLARQYELEKQNLEGSGEFSPDYKLVFIERLADYHICDQLKSVSKFDWVELIKSAKLLSDHQSV